MFSLLQLTALVVVVGLLAFMVGALVWEAINDCN